MRWRTRCGAPRARDGPSCAAAVPRRAGRRAGPRPPASACVQVQPGHRDGLFGARHGQGVLGGVRPRPAVRDDAAPAGRRRCRVRRPVVCEEGARVDGAARHGRHVRRLVAVDQQQPRRLQYGGCRVGGTHHVAGWERSAAGASAGVHGLRAIIMVPTSHLQCRSESRDTSRTAATARRATQSTVTAADATASGAHRRGVALLCASRCGATGACLFACVREHTP
eukprot:3093829-Prymnesium_polylepis.1